MGPPQASDPPSGRGAVSPAQAWLSLAILFVASLLVSTCRVLVENHAVQIPLVHWLNDRSLYPHDPFMAVLARYPSALWPAVALGARVFPLEGMLLVLLVLERLFVLYAAGRLALAFAPRSGLAVVGAMALFAFAIRPLLGGGTIVESYFEQTGLAIAVFMLAAAAFHERRTVAWAIWMGVGFSLTPMYGLFAGNYFGAAFVADPELRGAWRRWVGPFLLFLALAWYGIYAPVVAALSSRSDDAIWFLAARFRARAHLFPLAWDPWHFVLFAALIALFVTLLVHGRRERPRLFRQGLAWTAVTCLWILDAFLARYVLHSRPLMMMQPARATDLWLALAGTGIVSLAAARIEAASDAERRQAWIVVLGVAFLVWLPPGAWMVAVLLGFVALPAVWRRVGRWASPRWIGWGLVAWVLLVGAGVSHQRWTKSGNVRDVVCQGPERGVRQVAAWAEAHTARDAVFLVPTGVTSDFDEFMGLAKRSIFVNWELGAALNWAPDYLPEWMDRLAAVGRDLRPKDGRVRSIEPDKAYRELQDEDVARIKRRYRVDYWIVFSDQSSSHPELFRTEDYRVLDLR